MLTDSLPSFFQNDLSAQNALNSSPHNGQRTGLKEPWQDSPAQPNDYERSCTDANGCDLSDSWDTPRNKASAPKKKKGL